LFKETRNLDKILEKIACCL